MAFVDAPGRIVGVPDEFPFVGPPGPWEDGTLLMNQDGPAMYFWNADNPNPIKWEPLT